MSISPKCDICSQVLNDFGAIVLSPPDSDSKVAKYHVCKTCYKNKLKTLIKDN